MKKVLNFNLYLAKRIRHDIIYLPKIGNYTTHTTDIVKKGREIMDNLTRIIREEIGKQYKSVRQFAFAVDVPLSTVNSALHNGVGGSSFDTVLRLCKVLGIKAIGDDAAFYLTDDTEKLLTQYAKLDDYGRHTIAAVMQVEYNRCTELSKPDLEEHTSVNI